ncbi:MAG: DmsC/YnfH family molybdoenzyme membrane anchor subunit [Chthoniobacterales bacterium]
MSEGASILDETNLIDQLIAEQQTLTAVERFARRHDEGSVPAQARYYQDLIPLSKPARGQQYAFAVDLDACTGCKACVSACHSLNGLEEHETWRDVGLIVGERNDAPYQQTVTTACHHCAEPACLEGCPVMAYEKDADTGIVRHLDDQCIGCQYCTLKCPYGVPKYSERLGIVRKCDMCHDRLAAGEAPACVQACPHEAITIRLVDMADVSAAATPGTHMVPGAFDSSYTKPTTIYHSSKVSPQNAHPADAHKLHLEHAHWPLLVMLVLTQAAVGLFAAASVMAATNLELFRLAGFPFAATAFGLLNAGLFAAVFHLGRPLGAWRFFLGLRTSWMSREILAFSLMATVAAPAAGAAFLFPGTALALAPMALTAFLGLASVFTSAMIYIDTRRALWSAMPTFGRFYGATLLTGSTGSIVIFACLQNAPAFSAALVCGSAIHATFFIGGIASFRAALKNPHASAHLSATTLARLLPWLTPTRITLFASSIILAALDWFHVGQLTIAWSALIFVAAIGSAFLERYEFFTTVRAPHMPGGI